MIEITNLDEVQAKLNAWCVEAEKLAEETARGLIAHSFNRIVRRGPQYSGDFVANIRLSMDHPDDLFEGNVVNPLIDTPDGPRLAHGAVGAGDPRAMEYAKTNAVGPLSEFQLGKTAYISSTAQHKRDFYAFKIEKNKIEFRPENPFGGATFSRASNDIATLYKDLTLNKVRKLRSMTILGGEI